MDKLSTANSVNAQKETEKSSLNPLIILLGILLLAGAMTYFVESGQFDRDGRLVIPGSYEVIEKQSQISDIFRIGGRAENEAAPVSFIELLMTIPEGLERGGGLIFMVLIIGGMFGILTKAGAVDAGLERLLSMVKGNIYVLTIALMIVFSAGSTFLGLASEYLLVIPIMVAMSKRLGLSPIIGFAIVTVSVKVGYISSISNPLPLTIAQPLVGLQIFSGASVRAIFYLVFLTIAIAFMLLTIRAQKVTGEVSFAINHMRLSWRHSTMLMVLITSIGFLVYASNEWQWKHEAFSAYYIGISLLLAGICGLGANGAANAFVGGMKKVLLASILIGVASAVAVTLEKGQVLDSVVHSLVGMIGDSSPTVAATSMFVAQLVLDFLIPSTSGQAAVSMPIMGPIGQLSGVSAQTTVVAFLFGNGITNLITPTSGTLLAYLATANIGWVQWAKFILPLWFLFIITAVVLLAVSVYVGF
jgi:uncharacterized ion transporter superfamily protein YfcC